jgi:predicted ester cyclase
MRFQLRKNLMSATTPAANKAALIRLAALLETPDRDAILACFTEDFRLHDPRQPDWPRGQEAGWRMLLRLKSLAPDITATIDDMIAEDDRVAVRWRFTGTLIGRFEGIAGNGARYDAVTIAIYHFRYGGIAEDWGVDALLPEGHPWRGD